MTATFSTASACHPQARARIPRRYDRWTPERLAFAGLLAGQGLTLAEIAGHPRIGSTGEAVRKMFRRLGILLSEDVAPDAIRIPAAASLAFADAGRARQMTPTKVACEAILALGLDISLLDNVLDDGVKSR